MRQTSSILPSLVANHRHHHTCHHHNHRHHNHHHRHAHHTLSFNFCPPALIFSFPVFSFVDSFSLPLASFSRMFGMVGTFWRGFVKGKYFWGFISGTGSFTLSTPHLKIFRRFRECINIKISEIRIKNWKLEVEAQKMGFSWFLETILGSTAMERRVFFFSWIDWV